MVYWAQLLHFYQPPTQIHSVLARICDECYRPLLKVLQDYPHARVTVNICGVLTEMLSEHGHGDIIEMLKELAERGQIEFTGSGKYHPILPLIPVEEAERQIEENMRTNRQFIGETYAPKGFFPPELCYSYNIVDSVVKDGHQWVILSGVACPVDWPTDKVHEIDFRGKRLAVLFRDDILSNKVSFRSITSTEFLEHLRQLGNERRNIYVITAMDAETFGHHIKNWEREFLASVYEELKPAELVREMVRELFQSGIALENEEQEIRMVYLSEVVENLPRGELVRPEASSWSTSKKDMESNNPYPLWCDSGNEIHKLQWEHLGICQDMTGKAFGWADNKESQNYASTARVIMNSALHSDQFWWASGKPRWDINLVHKGLLMQKEVLLNAYKAISASGVSPEKKREYYYRLVGARELEQRIVKKLVELG